MEFRLPVVRPPMSVAGIPVRLAALTFTGRDAFPMQRGSLLDLATWRNAATSCDFP